jgi:hypothetical protein
VDANQGVRIANSSGKIRKERGLHLRVHRCGETSTDRQAQHCGEGEAGGARKRSDGIPCIPLRITPVFGRHAENALRNMCGPVKTSPPCLKLWDASATSSWPVG